MNADEKIESIVTIDILGDLCLAWYRLEKEEFLNVTKEINDCFGKADFRIANLESPFLSDENSSAILKEGPNSNLYIDKKYVDFIENLNIDAYTLANNHLGDFGERGIKDTIFYLKKLRKKYTGTSLIYKNIYKPLRVEIKNIKFSFFSICENEFGIARNNEIGAAGFQAEIVKKVIRQEEEWADYKIVIFHGGTEHYPFPTPNQKQRYHWLIDIGADLVVGMHQHCPVGYEKYQDTYIIYGLGNFFFPRKNRILYENWNVGYAARLFVKQDSSIEFKPIPFLFDNEGKKFKKIDDKKFESYFTEISKPIQSTNELTKIYKFWVVYSGKMHYEALKHCIAKDDKYSFNIVKNLFSCEAHNELLTTYLNLYYYEPGFEYKDKFRFIQKYINAIHENNIINNKTVYRTKNNKICVLWGVGEKAEKIYKNIMNEHYEIRVIDKDFYKQGFYFFHSKIESPESVIFENTEATYYICTSKIHIENIKLELLLAGVSKERILIG